MESTLNRLPSANGQAKGKRRRSYPVGGKAKAQQRQLSARRRVALAVGGTGCSVLALSVWHCTEALALLTGSPPFLAFLLAVGIDCGLVACEVAAVVADNTARRWSRWYVGLSVGLSALLNAVASAQHAAPEFAWLAYGVGALVPVLVLILGQVASHLWTEGA